MPLSSVVGAQSIIRPGVCTSSTRPASPYDGQVIYMTDVDQTAVWDGTQWTVLAPIAGGRNLLINGDFKVWQRGNARTYLAGSSLYLADRWCTHLYQNAGHERVAGRATQYAMRVSSSSTTEAAGGTRMWLTQKVESLNSYRLRSQPVTLSFWVRFSAATASSSTATPYGNWTAAIGYYNTTTDSATATTDAQSVSTLALTNGSLPTTWTKYSVTGTCPSDLNNIHATFGFASLGNTAANSGVWYEVSEVQLEAGAVATPFEFEDYGTTLDKCQRYFQLINSYMGTGDFNIMMVREAATQGQATIYLPVAMRTLPTLVGTTYGRCVFRDTSFGLTTSSVSAISINSSGPSTNAITLVITHGSAAGTYVFSEWDMNATSANLGLSSEL